MDAKKKELQDLEKNLIQQGQPTINMMGAQAAESTAILGRLVKAQLKSLGEDCADYVSGDQMPHEWGSLDSYDDMRGAIHWAEAMLEAVIDPMFPSDFQNAPDHDLTTEDGVRGFLREFTVNGPPLFMACEEVVKFVENGDGDWDNKPPYNDAS